MEYDSTTAFTSSSQWWGTRGYIPPEFQSGGFKHADATGDIFMLGKSFYNLITGREPDYIVGNGLPDPLFHVIQRCCEIDKSRRYQTTSDLKQNIVTVYDILLKRVDGPARSKQLLAAVSLRVAQQQTFDPNEVLEFLDSLEKLEPSDRISVITEVPSWFFILLTFDPQKARLPRFLDFYRGLVHKSDYSWEYAEIIGSNMKTIFDADDVEIHSRADALDLAIFSASAMNRFRAMDLCRDLIISVTSNDLAFVCCDVLKKHSKTFIKDIEPVSCKNDLIRNTIRDMKI